MKKLFAGAAILFFVAVSAQAQTRTELAPTPPMGWNSWNWHGKHAINEDIVKETIDAMADEGLRDAGYIYVVIDGGWRDTKVGPKGQLISHPTKFPGGIKPLADYAHSKGLKFGLHTVPGTHDCGGDPVGGFGREEVHIGQFVDWGVDFLKVDKCRLTSGWNEDLVKETYEKWQDLLEKADREIVLSISAYVYRDWYPKVCQMARTTLDIHSRIHKGGARFDDPTIHCVMNIAEKNNESAEFAGNGYWNDPDMVVVGEHGLSQEEQKSHFALWCVMSAPLMLGNDPRNMTQAEKDIVLNADCIAIDQDPSEQGRRIKVDGDGEIWVKKLSDGRVAALLLNRNGEKTVPITFNWADVGFAGAASVKDVYAKKELGVLGESITKPTLPHACHLLILSPTNAKPRPGQ